MVWRKKRELYHLKAATLNGLRKKREAVPSSKAQRRFRRWFEKNLYRCTVCQSRQRRLRRWPAKET
ncbi:Hypothetical predicted protein [Mytilus galloprovincialis]|uniref:Uncharacterized protein n=1 Tax=Mytilus galloprovincialis TaxID=29158 RepID=A0A8B6DQ78_MYTGA|nr:Hypothetical predicted protein [Mytilus galloprovincialis]